MRLILNISGTGVARQPAKPRLPPEPSVDSLSETKRLVSGLKRKITMARMKADGLEVQGRDGIAVAGLRIAAAYAARKLDDVVLKNAAPENAGEILRDAIRKLDAAMANRPS